MSPHRLLANNIHLRFLALSPIFKVIKWGGVQIRQRDLYLLVDLDRGGGGGGVHTTSRLTWTRNLLVHGYGRGVKIYGGANQLGQPQI